MADPIDLSLDDMRIVARDELAPSVALLLDALEEGDVIAARTLAGTIETAAQALRYGRVV